MRTMYHLAVQEDLVFDKWSIVRLVVARGIEAVVSLLLLAVAIGILVLAVCGAVAVLGAWPCR